MIPKTKLTDLEKVIISFMVIGCIFWGVIGFAIYAYLTK